MDCCLIGEKYERQIAFPVNLIFNIHPQHLEQCPVEPRNYSIPLQVICRRARFLYAKRVLRLLENGTLKIVTLVGMEDVWQPKPSKIFTNSVVIVSAVWLGIGMASAHFVN